MTYRERLWSPVSYWVIGLTIGISTVAAVGLYISTWVAIGSAVAVTIAIAAVIGWFGRIELVVDEDGVRVGASLLEWPYVGHVEALDEHTTTDRLGPRADTRAFVVQRSWIPEAVVITVEDPADPHPYWIVSSRQPAQFAAAIERARPSSDRVEP